MNEKICISVCNNFAIEVKTIVEQNSIDNVEVLNFPANCGKPPLKIENIEKLNTFNNCEKNCILGSVCLKELNKNTTNDKYQNIFYFDTCFEMVLNKDLVNHYISKGFYLVTPGWLNNWESEISNLGFTKETAPGFYRETSKSILFLDTGINSESKKQIEEFALFVNLPFEVLPVGLEHLKFYIIKIISEIHEENERNNSERKIADYSMMMDLLNNLSVSVNEKDVIDKIISIFSILFAPTHLNYLAVNKEEASKLISNHSVADEQNLIDNLLNLNEIIIPTTSGFKCQLIYNGELVGAIEISGVAFPQYLEHYQNIVTSIIQIAALVISNARTYQIIVNQKEKLTKTLQELKETQKLLVESEKMASLGNLVAGVAHEINTPVGVSITAASSLLKKVSNLDQLFNNNDLTKSSFEISLDGLKRTSDLILKNMQRTADLVSSFKRVSVDEASERMREFDLKQYLNDILTNFHSQLISKEINTKIICDNNIIMNSYPGALAQVITNLVDNSIKHAFNSVLDSQISIMVEITGNFVQIKYSDNGNGVSKENLSKIFDPFFTTDKQEGSGLGLHIVYNLVSQKLEGVISCESNVGDGALFNIKIPINVKASNEVSK